MILKMENEIMKNLFRFSIFLTLLFGFINTTLKSKEVSMLNQWFNYSEHNLLVINKFKSISDRTIISSVNIEDTVIIKSMVERISAIPANGDKMVNPGPKTEETELLFKNGTNVDKIMILGRRFKTPSTGFNSGKSEIEEELYKDIENLLLRK
jgi:hypothetical protein